MLPLSQISTYFSLFLVGTAQLPPPLWSGPHGDATGYYGGLQIFPTFQGGNLSYAYNSSASFTQCGVVILGDGSIVGSAASEEPFPVLQAIMPPPNDGAGWVLSLDSSKFGGAVISELLVCGSDTLVAVVTAVSADRPPTWFWEGLVAYDISGGGALAPPGSLWFFNSTTAMTFPPSSYNNFGCNASSVVLAGAASVIVLDVVTGIVQSRVKGLIPQYVTCIVAVNEDTVVCLDDNDPADTGGVIGLRLSPLPFVAWTAAGQGWTIGSGGSPGHPAFSSSIPGGLVVLTSFDHIYGAAAQTGKLAWSVPFPGPNVEEISSEVLTAIPAWPNELSIVVVAANLANSSKELGTILALDLASGRQVARGSIPDGAQLTNALVLDASGTVALISAWDATWDKIAIYQCEIDITTGSVLVSALTPWVYSAQITQFLAVGPSAGQIIALDSTGSLSILSPAEAPPPCTWSPQLASHYIAHCANDGCTLHATAAGAQELCAASYACSGITSDVASGKWSLRSANETQPSPDGESSFFISNAAICHPTV